MRVRGTDPGRGRVADITLAEARDAAARRNVRAGVNPTAPVEVEATRTFRNVVEAYVTAQEAKWKNPVHRAK